MSLCVTALCLSTQIIDAFPKSWLESLGYLIGESQTVNIPLLIAICAAVRFIYVKPYFHNLYVVVSAFTIDIFVCSVPPEAFSTCFFISWKWILILTLFIVTLAVIVKMLARWREYGGDGVETEGNGFVTTTPRYLRINCGWQNYIECVCSHIDATKIEDDSLAIAVTGYWGSGKTTFIEALKAALEQMLTFDAWQCDSPRQLVSDFFMTLATLLSSEHFKKDIARYLDALLTFDTSGVIDKIKNLTRSLIPASTFIRKSCGIISTP